MRIVADIVLTVVEWSAAAAFAGSVVLAWAFHEPGFLVAAGLAAFVGACARSTAMLRRTGEERDRLRRQLP